ncbi:hypothetical protein [Alsobacter sp. SYSU BS001988]
MANQTPPLGRPPQPSDHRKEWTADERAAWKAKRDQHQAAWRTLRAKRRQALQTSDLDAARQALAAAKRLARLQAGERRAWGVGAPPGVELPQRAERPLSDAEWSASLSPRSRQASVAATPWPGRVKQPRPPPTAGWTPAQFDDWAALQAQQRRDWDEIETLRRRADVWGDDAAAKLVEVAIETLRIAQDGEIRAWAQTGSVDDDKPSALTEEERQALIAEFMDAWDRLAALSAKKAKAAAAGASPEPTRGDPGGPTADAAGPAADADAFSREALKRPA